MQQQAMHQSLLTNPGRFKAISAELKDAIKTAALKRAREAAGVDESKAHVKTKASPGSSGNAIEAALRDLRAGGSGACDSRT